MPRKIQRYPISLLFRPVQAVSLPGILILRRKAEIGLPLEPLGPLGGETLGSHHCTRWQSKYNGKLPDLTAVEIGWRCRRGCWRTGGTVQPPLATRAEGLGWDFGDEGLPGLLGQRNAENGKREHHHLGKGNKKKRCACNPRTPPHISLVVVRPELPLPSPPPFHSHPYCYSPPGGLDEAILDTASQFAQKGATNTDCHRQRDCGGISAQWNVPDAIVRRR